MSNEMAGISHRSDLIGADVFWRIINRDYDGDQLVYIGKNTVIDALESSSTWTIWRNFYDDGVLVKVEGPITGAWTSRTSLGWVGSAGVSYDFALSQETDVDDTNDLLRVIIDELKTMNIKLDIVMEEI